MVSSASRTLLAVLLIVGLSTPVQSLAAPPGAKDVTVTLFQWPFARVASDCTNVLGPKGYGYVEVSPATEHIQGPQWWLSDRRAAR